MKVPLEWLKEYVDIEMDPERLADLLTNTGTEVVSVDYPAREVKGVVIGRIREIQKHPHAQNLKVCRVDWGKGEGEIVCGAPNIFPEAKVAVALPGSTLASGRKILEEEIRGIKSQGMICSGQELGVNDDFSGVLILGEREPVGEDFSRRYHLGEAVFELDITPNRPDCLSMVGMAREVAVLTGKAIRMPSFMVQEGTEPVEDHFSVEILDPDLCPRYVARMIAGVAIADSPLWMQMRLWFSGVRPLGNVVDCTNYVMLELGQPLHAFDADKIADSKIIVRRARRGETMVTLDGVRRSLDEEDLLICDPSGPIALAGVMGGENTEVSGSTSRVLLESAYFSPPAINRTSRKHDIPSEASYRFSRGVDPSGSLLAANRAIQLMKELAGGVVYANAIDQYPHKIHPVKIDLRPLKASAFLGAEISRSWILSTMKGLGLRPLRGEEDGETITFEVPTYRPDLEREIDLIEEVARIHGYWNISATLPASRSRAGKLSMEQKKRRRLYSLLTGLGLHEVISYAFVSPEKNGYFQRGEEKPRAIRLANPISEEMSEMRTSLYPGLLNVLLHNFNRGIGDLAIFEVGRIFGEKEEGLLPEEKLMLGVALMGNWEPRQWDTMPRQVDFYTMKGIWERLLEEFRIVGGSLERTARDYFHPHLAANLVIGSETAGELGTLHPLLLRRLELPEGIVVMQLDLDILFRQEVGESIYRDIPRYPSIQMDLSLVVPERVEVGSVMQIIESHGGDLLYSVRLFDLYRGEQVGDGYKSLAFSLVFLHPERTLKEEEAKSSMDNIVKALGKILGARIRE